MSDDPVSETPPPPPVEATVANTAPAPAPAPKAVSQKEVQNWCMASHLAGLLGLMFPVIGNIGGPLAVWLMKKDELPEVDRHAKEALNFQISFLIWNIIATSVAGVLVLLLIGFLLLPLVWVAYYLLTLIFPIMAGLKASEGKEFFYPMTIRFLK